jgi:hypothetical protein
MYPIPVVAPLGFGGWGSRDPLCWDDVERAVNWDLQRLVTFFGGEWISVYLASKSNPK